MLPAIVVQVPAPVAGTLESVLDRIYWSASNQDTLLIVAPECYTPIQSSTELPPNLFRSLTLIRSDGRRRFPGRSSSWSGESLACFCPTSGFRLDVVPGAFRRGAGEDALQFLFTARLRRQLDGLGFGDRASTERLLATLTEAQWKAIGSARGLGESQLEGSGQQRKLFRSTLSCDGFADIRFSHRIFLSTTTARRLSFAAHKPWSGPRLRLRQTNLPQRLLPPERPATVHFNR